MKPTSNKVFHKCPRFASSISESMRSMHFQLLESVAIKARRSVAEASHKFCSRVAQEKSSGDLIVDNPHLSHSIAGWGGSPKLRPALHDHWPNMVQPIGHNKPCNLGAKLRTNCFHTSKYLQASEAISGQYIACITGSSFKGSSFKGKMAGFL